MNYILRPDGQEPVEHKFIDAAIKAGGNKFIIWLEGMLCCVNHPDTGLIYSEEYKEWYANCQKAYEGVAK